MRKKMTMSDVEVPGMNDKCETCKNSRGWHLEEKPRHPFNDGSTSFKTTFGARTPHDGKKTAQDGAESVSRVPWPHDPVLRQALIDLGIVTSQNLRDAEDKIRAVTAAFLEGGRNGEGEVQERTAT
jgi:hypothetical protein